MADKLERLYTVPLSDAYNTVRKKRARRAVSILRAFVSRNMKSEIVLLSNKVNSFVWQYSIEKPPRRVKIRAIKQDGKVNVYLQDEKLEEKKEIKKDEVKKDENKDKKEQKDKEQKAETKSEAIKSEQKKNQEKQVSELKQRLEQKSGIR